MAERFTVWCKNEILPRKSYLRYIRQDAQKPHKVGLASIEIAGQCDAEETQVAAADRNSVEDIANQESAAVDHWPQVSVTVTITLNQYLRDARSIFEL